MWPCQFPPSRRSDERRCDLHQTVRPRPGFNSRTGRNSYLFGFRVLTGGEGGKAGRGRGGHMRWGEGEQDKVGRFATLGLRTSFYLFGGVSHPLRAPHHGWRVRLKRVDRHECFFCWCSAGWGAAQGGRRQRGGSGERGWRKAGLIFLSLHSAVPLETHLATAPLATRQSREAAPAPSYTSSLPTPAHLTLRAARPRRAEGRHTFQKKKKAFNTAACGRPPWRPPSSWSWRPWPPGPPPPGPSWLSTWAVNS